jgi:SAM-dependent methyltransferase
MQREQPAQEIDDEQQVLLPMRQFLRASFRVVEPPLDVGNVLAQRRHALAGDLLTDKVTDQQPEERLALERREWNGGPRVGPQREALIGLARERVPDADLRVGDMEALPYDDDTFDLVTGFNSFFFATDMGRALREAGRVAKPGSPVVIQVWGPHERNDLEAMKEIVRPFMPPRPANAPPEPELWKPGVLEQMAGRAGLVPESVFDTTWAYEPPDEATLRQALVAPAGIAVLVGPEREEEVGDAIAAGLAAYRTADGSYRLENESHGLIARAGG